MRLRYLQITALLLFNPNLYAADQLLIMDVYARIVPAGQIAPIPDLFVESIVRGEPPAKTEGIRTLQGKSFQITSKFQDFAPVVSGVDDQRVSIEFSAAVLLNGNCQISPYRTMALDGNSKGQIKPIGSSATVSSGGFTLTPGSRIPESVSVQTGGVTVVYYLIFSTAKGLTEE
jgi:hypothetical protein